VTFLILTCVLYFFLYHPIYIFLAKAQFNYLQIQGTLCPATRPQTNKIEYNENLDTSQ